MLFILRVNLTQKKHCYVTGIIPRLDPNQWTILTLEITPTIPGEIRNLATVEGTPADYTGTPLIEYTNVTDEDPACIIIVDKPYKPSVDIEKYVNSDDADEYPGLLVPSGSSLTYEFEVKNTGCTNLINLNVTDKINLATLALSLFLLQVIHKP